ncbi:MAG: hypothetical protein E4G92_00465 [Bacteroidia bacterium]|nr:MAG: hypothetical protein E4G92_00465 [Bacteroidia bacterium]
MMTPPALMTYMKSNHATRTEKWLYISYTDGTEKVYDHESDPNEWFNLAQDPEYREGKASLKKYVPQTDAEQVKDLKK